MTPLPLPAHPRIEQLARQVGLLNAYTGVLTVVYGVIVRLDWARLLAHEFVHVAQYERLGREGFLEEYIRQIAEHGYQTAPFELEADTKADKACRDAKVAPLVVSPVKERALNDGPKRRFWPNISKKL